MRVYLDSSIVIRLIEGNEVTQLAIREQYQDVASFTPCTSWIVRLECLPKARRSTESRLSDDYDLFLLSTENLAIGDAVFEYAVNLRVKSQLKSIDALHLAVAVLHGCDEFWTADADFASVPQGIPLRVFVQKF